MATQKRLYELVAEVESFSRPGKVYEVKKDMQSGRLSCNCPAWIFQRGGIRRDCKHITSLRDAN